MTQRVPFSLRNSLAKRTTLPARIMVNVLERCMGLPQLNELYLRSTGDDDASAFVRRLLHEHMVDVHVEDSQLENIPARGSAIVIANHPCGAIDGIVMAELLKRIRPDIKIMANYLLHCIPEMRELFINVDPFGSNDSVRGNLKSLREAIRWVNGGGLLMIFPAGEVSHYNFRQRKISDPEWSNTLARIVRITRAPVVSVHLSGRNSLAFQVAGCIHPRLRTVMLVRELLNKKGCNVAVNVGRAIHFGKLERLSDAARMDYLRLQTYRLGEKAPATRVTDMRVQVPIIEPVDPQRLIADVNALPAAQILVSHGDMHVYIARAEQIPHVLQELGRLRETTFRLTQEGTGNATDLDHYDDHYLHLFLWHAGNDEVVGAYRLGLVDEISSRFGKRGLYTYALFHYNEQLLREFRYAIELGRSFVRPEYQRSFAPLLMLLRGIFTFAARNPKYRYLFGPVSISDNYNTIARKLLITFLEENSFLPNLARHVKPRHPFRSMDSIDRQSDLITSTDIQMISELVSGLQEDHKQMPVMLKQYLKLGARLLGFSVDKSFSNVVDGLIMLDMPQADVRVLNKYMGEDGASAYLRYHGRIAECPPANGDANTDTRKVAEC